MADTLLTIAEAGKTTRPDTAGLQVIIIEENPMLQFIQWHQLSPGHNFYQWFRETQRPSVAFRAVNASWDADVGIKVSKQEGLSILGGEIEIDRFILNTMGSELDERMFQRASKMRAAERKWEETFFEGDRAVDANAFDGLRARAAESSMDFDMSGGTDVAALTLAKLDEVLDAVLDSGTRVIVANQWLLRKVNALMRAAGQAREMVSGEFGQQFSSYAGVPMIKQQQQDDMSSILDFDEDPGDGGDDAASLYVINFDGEDSGMGVFGILGAGGAWEINAIAEQQEAVPRALDRVEVYPGLVTPHPRCFGRINSIGQI